MTKIREIFVIINGKPLYYNLFPFLLSVLCYLIVIEIYIEFIKEPFEIYDWSVKEYVRNTFHDSKAEENTFFLLLFLPVVLNLVLYILFRNKKLKKIEFSFLFLSVFTFIFSFCMVAVIMNN